MARSPSGADSEPRDADPYRAGWTAINRLIRRGYSWSGHERDVAFLNVTREELAFADVSYVSGLDDPGDGRALARVDWDFDGDQDLLRCSRTGPRLRVLRNGLRAGGSGARWLALRLVGAAPNTDAVGASVELSVDGGSAGRLIGTRRIGEGYLAQSSAWLHFGLGAGRAREAVVRWPNAAPETFACAGGDFLVLRQGSGRAEAFEPPASAELSAGALREEVGDPGGKIVLAWPLPVPRLDLVDRVGPRTLLGIEIGRQRGTGEPILLSLFSRTCAPCGRELAGLGAAARELDRAGVGVLALSVDPEQESAEVDAFVDRTGFAGPVAHASTDALEVLDALAALVLDQTRRLGLPASFLIDAQGRLQVLYARAVEPAEVIVDLRLLDLEGEERRRAAVPFHGRFLLKAPEPDLERLIGVLEERGLSDAAEQVRRARVRVQDIGAAEIELGKSLLLEGDFSQAVGHFEAALARDPLASDAWKGLAYCRHRLEDRAGARAAYVRALDLDPDDEINRVNLALVLIELGETDAAREQVAELAARGSPHAELLAARLR